MRNKLMESTAANPLGECGGQKLLRVSAGQYAGRTAVIVAVDANTIKLTWADPPYLVWSTPQTVVSDAADSSFDCLITSAGDIHLAYAEQTTIYLVTRKLTFASGSWSVGSKVTAYNGTQCYSPSLAIERAGTLWLSYCQLSGSNRTVYIKSSTDAGASWGSGSTDGGDMLGGTGLDVYSRIAVGLNDLFAVYCYSGQYLAMRTKPLSGGSWSSEVIIASGSSLAGNFDAAVRADGMVGVVWCAGGLYYMEYDGSVWSAPVQLDEGATSGPSLMFVGNEPVIVYFEAYDGVQRLIRQTARHNGIFSSPAILDIRSGPFSSVQVYSSGATSYVDRTAQASDDTAGDVSHPSSGCMLSAVGDSLCLGMKAPFRYIQTLMSQSGVGGAIQFSYYNGTAWEAFVPVSGATAFGSSPDRTLLWDDYNSIPADWQECEVNSVRCFWIKLEVTSSFSSGPVGTRLTAVAENGLIVVRR